MTIHEYRRIFRERWLILLLAVLLGAAAGAGLYVLRPPTYTAYLQMYVSTRPIDARQPALQGEGIPERRIKSYVALTTSPRVASAVVTQLGLDMSPAEVASKVSASRPSDSVVINLYAVDRSPERAAQIANATGQALSGVVDQLERSTTTNGVSPVIVSVVQPAATPLGPTGRGLAEWIVLGILVGLATGVALALVRNAMDNTIKSVAQLRQVAGVPNLGLIAFDGQASKRPLIVHEDPQSARAEAFRQLRTNVQFVDIENQHKILTVTSAMAGEGKTTTLVNLAIALAAAGGSVLIVEADLRRPMVAKMLGMDRAFGLTSVIAARMPVQNAIQSWNEGPTVDVLASGPLPPNPSELLANHRMKALLTDLRSRYDVILVDTPALVPVTDAASVVPATDGAILLCRFHETTKPQIEAAVDALRAVAAPVLGSVFTMVPASNAGGLDVYPHGTGEPPARVLHPPRPMAPATPHGQRSVLPTEPVPRPEPGSRSWRPPVDVPTSPRHNDGH